ncbi:MAG: hypothetical protein ACHQXA_00025 [Gemmatimonadales bacterium]
MTRWPDGTAARCKLIAPILLLLALLPPDRLPAQQPLRAAGRIVRLAGGDTVPVAGIEVVLHRVSPKGSGPLDSLRADPRGRFHFTMRRDTTVTYLVSAKYAGVAYFSPPLGTGTPLDTTVLLLVADTSSGVAAPVSLSARHLVIERPADDGSRRVTDLLVLHNPGPDTRVAPDTVRAAWGIRLPRGVIDVAPGDGDFSPDAVVFRNDSALIFAPISLGEAQMVIQYTLPPAAGVVGLPIEDSIPSLNVLVEEGGAKVEGRGLAAGTPEQLDGRAFTRWSGAIPAGSMVTVRLGGGGAVPAWILPVLIALTAAGLGAVAVRAWQARPRMARPMPSTASKLVDQVARLDLRYAGRERELPAEEWGRYLADRSRLARQLEAALAAVGPAA